MIYAYARPITLTEALAGGAVAVIVGVAVWAHKRWPRQPKVIALTGILLGGLLSAAVSSLFEVTAGIWPAAITGAIFGWAGASWGAKLESRRSQWP